MEWTITDEHMTAETKDFDFTNKFAWFDLDGTIIKTASGKRYPIGPKDWKWWDASVPAIIKQLRARGYCIVIVSNQYGVGSGRLNPKEWKTKLNSIQNKLDVPLKIYASCKKNIYRKPIPTFFKEVGKSILKTLDKSKSFYCGDACGRQGDHSNTDYKFALNCGIKFVTPEKLFLKQRVDVPDLVYPDVWNEDSNNDLTDEIDTIIKKGPELIMMVGLPASGKSTIAKYIRDKFGYQIISQDALKTKTKCLKKMRELMMEKKSLILDNTNTNPDARKAFIKLATQRKYKIKCIIVDCDFKLCQHRNWHRMMTQDRELIKDVTYRTLMKHYVEPTKKSDGVNVVIKVKPFAIEDDNYAQYLY